MYTPSNTPSGKFQVLLAGKRDWQTVNIQQVAQALRSFSARPAEDYNNMIYYALAGDTKGDIRLGDDWYRFYPF